jgi:GTPase
VKYSNPDEEKSANSFVAQYNAIKEAQNFSGQKVMDDIEPESDLGNTEYKLMLKFPKADRIERLTTQMKFRIQEGAGEAFYYIGVKDNGEAFGITADQMELSLRTLHRMASTLNLNLVVRSITKGKNGEIAKVMAF